ncbi:MAG: hypothetical protein J3R72DRAFT_464169 [Linnemannia gamsii]|nr:MAG: hypothetical protein J3R72DRAFT_464169 [Linnemannia gamsii]
MHKFTTEIDMYRSRMIRHGHPAAHCLLFLLFFAFAAAASACGKEKMQEGSYFDSDKTSSPRIDRVCVRVTYNQ